VEDDEASGLIVKLPFLARSAFIRRASTVDQVRKVLALAGKRYPHAKFATIQHCLANAKVYQVVVLAGVARYVVVPRASNPWPRVSFSSADHTAIRTFAEEAIRNLQNHDKQHSLNAVDIRTFAKRCRWLYQEQRSLSSTKMKESSHAINLVVNGESNP